MNAPIRTYDELIAGLAARKTQLGLTNDMLDALAGTPAGYAGKIFGPARVRALGPQSLEYFLGALGLTIQLVEDADSARRIESRIKNGKGLMEGVHQIAPRNRTLKDSVRRFSVRHGRKGGRKSQEIRMSWDAERRSEIQRKAALNGWKRRREIGKAIEQKLERKVP